MGRAAAGPSQLGRTPCQQASAIVLPRPCDRVLKLSRTAFDVWLHPSDGDASKALIASRCSPIAADSPRWLPQHGAVSHLYSRCLEVTIKAGRVIVLGSDRLTSHHLRLVAARPKTPVRRDYGLVPLFSEEYLDRLHRIDRTSGALQNVAILSPDKRTSVMADALERRLGSLDPSLRVVIVRRHALHHRERRPQDFLRLARRLSG